MITVKGGGGMLNNPPVISDLKVNGNVNHSEIPISYKVTDADLQIVRHYITVKSGEDIIFDKKEITNEVGYEKPNNIFNFTVTGLKRQSAYTIQITCTDGLVDVNSIAIQISTKDFDTFGFVLDENIADPKNPERVKYIDGSAGIPPATAENGLGEWENHFPFNEIKMFGYKNGVRTKEINKNNKKLYIDGTPIPPDVDIFTRFPKIWVAVNKTGSKITVKLSKKRIAGSRCCAHWRKNKEYNYLSIGAYRASQDGNKIRSLSSKSIGSYTLSIADVYNEVKPSSPNLIKTRTFARNYNQNAELYLWSSDQLLKILYILAFKSTDRDILGIYNTASTTGSADEKGFIAKATASTSSVFLGLEDIWGMSGGGGSYIDGILMVMDVDSVHYEFLYYLNDSNNYSNSDYRYDWANNYKKIGRPNLSGDAYNRTTFLQNCTGRSDIPFSPYRNGGSASTCYTASIKTPMFSYSENSAYFYILQESLFSVDWSKKSVKTTLRLNLFED